MSIRVLLFADTHLGFDTPIRPRVKRRRRGDDFFANYERVLDHAVSGAFDILVHGGDLFFRSKVPPELVQRAFLPLKKVADTGLPIYIVPGNHERSRIPYDMLALHPNIRIFDRPRTSFTRVGDEHVALSGFPYARGVRTSFPQLLDATEWHHTEADTRLLCVHHCFEGATVGPSDYVFRYNDDVIRHRDIPAEFAAVLTGHIHRAQVLTADLRGQPLDVPVFYPGSIERTSTAERDETKGFFELEIDGNQVSSHSFVELPARPMIDRDLTLSQLDVSDPLSVVRQVIDSVPHDAVLRVKVAGRVPARVRETITPAMVRQITPETMNVDITMPDMRPNFRKGKKR